MFTHASQHFKPEQTNLLGNEIHKPSNLALKKKKKKIPLMH